MNGKEVALWCISDPAASITRPLKELNHYITLFAGKQYAASNENFGVFKEASPDRWGQLLMKRREILLS